MEQKQRFSIRKFKNGVGSALLLSLLVTPMVLQSTVSAEESETEEVVTQQQLGNATNYATIQSSPTEDYLAMAKKANTSEGEIINKITSGELTSAIASAKEAGVRVTVAEAVNFDTLEAGQADYTAQVEAVKAITDKAIAAQKAYEAAQAAYQTYLVAQAQYEKDNTLYQAYLKAKSDYDKAYADYQAAYKVYETALAENKKAIEQYNADKAAYDKAYADYQKALNTHNTVSESNAKKKADYEAALAQYQKDYQAYQAALATYTSASADNARLKAEYDAAVAEYKTLKAEYDAKKAEYDKKVEEATRLTGVDGYATRALAQSLNLADDEVNSTVNITGNIKKSIASSDETNLYHLSQSVLNGNENMSSNVTKMSNPNIQTWAEYGVVVASGQTLTATFTGLEKSTYDGSDISSIKMTITPISSDGSDLVVFLSDKITNGYEVYSLVGNVKDNVTLQFFDNEGKIIAFKSSAPALFGYGSLNRHPGSLEYISNYNFEFVRINGSTILEHPDGIYSDGDNDYKANGSKYDNVEWDPDGSPLAYYGAGIGVVTSGDTLRFTAGNREFVGHWTDITSKVAASGILEQPPVEPTAPTPPKYTVTGNNPEEPVKPTEPTYEETTEPTPPTEPTKPVIVEPVKPTEPTKPTEVPKPNEVEEVIPPTVPAPLEIKVHPNTYTSKPTIQKEVTNEAGEDLSNALVPKGSTVNFPLQLPTLTAGRPEYKVLTVTDNIPEGYELNVDAVVAAFPEFTVSYDEKTRVLTLEGKEELVASINKDRTKEFGFEKRQLTGLVTNDGAVYENTFQVTLDNSYTIYSNTVRVTTPGKPNDPDNPQNNLIQPTKQVVNAEGKDINGQAVGLKDTLTYPLLWDMDQYSAIKDGDGAKDIYFYFDLYDPSKVTVDLEASKTMTDAAGQAVTDIDVTNYASFADMPEDIQKAFEAANLKELVGEKSILLYLPKDMAAFEENYIKKGNSINLTFVAQPKREAAGQEIENIAVQVDFGNGYVTNKVTNKVQVTTEWEDRNGTVLKDKVTGDKTEEAGGFDRYRFVETKETDTGIKHIFEKLYTTEWVDEQGNALKEKVEDTDTKEHGTIDRYEFVKTVDTETGIKHIFKRIVEQPTQPKKNLPLTGEQATVGLVGLGLALLGLIAAWRFKLIEKLKNALKK
ncbi:GbpC/Spa domain-containing protein [Streptococcus suis]|uniref:SspB-related isopeptide-forming adhesin n=1 Tax=Streptococcus suis TaxID=1307 RepID=UPI0038BCD7CC